jgi:protein translocase SecG subunit
MLSANVHRSLTAEDQEQRRLGNRRLQITCFGDIARPMSILLNLLLALFVIVALLMVLVILMQRPKSEGLGAAFGGGMTDNLFGAQTTNVLTKVTGWLAGTFFVLTFLSRSCMRARQTRRAGSANASRRLRRRLTQ